MSKHLENEAKVNIVNGSMKTEEVLSAHRGLPRETTATEQLYVGKQLGKLLTSSRRIVQLPIYQAPCPYLL